MAHPRVALMTHPRVALVTHPRGALMAHASVTLWGVVSRSTVSHAALVQAQAVRRRLDLHKSKSTSTVEPYRKYLKENIPKPKKRKKKEKKEKKKKKRKKQMEVVDNKSPNGKRNESAEKQSVTVLY
jgi:hypothetical protein